MDKTSHFFSLPHGYYSHPSPHELNLMSEEELRQIENFRIGNDHGEIRYLKNVDLRDIDFKKVFKIRHKKIEVYPD